MKSTVHNELENQESIFIDKLYALHICIVFMILNYLLFLAFQLDFLVLVIFSILFYFTI